MDEKWWKEYAKEAHNSFIGEKLSITRNCVQYGVTRVMNCNNPMDTFGNSGSGAVALAALRGAARVLLLGYDCQRTGGKAHWHPDHPAKLGNAGSLPRWKTQFNKLATHVNGKLQVINCTRSTALDCFPRAALESVL